jgi:hypothetical protein
MNLVTVLRRWQEAPKSPDGAPVLTIAVSGADEVKLTAEQSEALVSGLSDKESVPGDAAAMAHGLDPWTPRPGEAVGATLHLRDRGSGEGLTVPIASGYLDDLVAFLHSCLFRYEYENSSPKFRDGATP